MKVFFNSKEEHSIDGPIAVALGTFDGIHIAHQMLIKQLDFINRIQGYSTLVYTFTNNPADILSPGKSPSRLMTTMEKIKGFDDLHIDYLLLDTFHRELASMAPSEFLKDILLSKYNIKYIVVGYDFKFGAFGSGDIGLLREIGIKKGFKVVVVPPMSLGGEIVSSSLIRNLIKDGEIGKASMYLGNPYSMTGRVVPGFGRGEKLGFPTANIAFDPRKTIPKSGVYLTKVKVDGLYHWGMTNVGKNPTFNDEGLFIETHILDHKEDLYDKVLKVEFLERIRDEKRFQNEKDLRAQIGQDVRWAKNCVYKSNPL